MEKEEQQQTFITDFAELEREKEKEREIEQKKAEIRAKKRKLIPPFVMLLAGAASSITMYVMHYKSKDMLVILLCVLLAFYIVGELLKWMLDRFEAQVEERLKEAGEVYAKAPDGTAESVDITDEAQQEEEEGESVQVGRLADNDEEELIF
ncbi:MAG: hypothetical protein NC231_05390 [Bacillus sp. (in: Bacteria)]|nr:hypothetical protein [Bacillus sp. (in: firmicutes)]MCM1425967.1 hypothetical protein [Eubacterium sp.]